jgi:hypothetical protein
MEGEVASLGKPCALTRLELGQFWDRAQARETWLTLRAWLFTITLPLVFRPYRSATPCR